jgi:hypothetical protein
MRRGSHFCQDVGDVGFVAGWEGDLSVDLTAIAQCAAAIASAAAETLLAEVAMSICQ